MLHALCSNGDRRVRCFHYFVITVEFFFFFCLKSLCNRRYSAAGVADKCFHYLHSVHCIFCMAKVHEPQAAKFEETGAEFEKFQGQWSWPKTSLLRAVCGHAYQHLDLDPDPCVAASSANACWRWSPAVHLSRRSQIFTHGCSVPEHVVWSTVALSSSS